MAEATTAVPGMGKMVNFLFDEKVVGQATQLKQLKAQLETVIKARLKKAGKTRLVVFVDDLDRMNPGKAVELLEVIKIFLDIAGCVYVLAVDYGVVSRGVRQKYGENMDVMKGRSFFDKIIQLPFNLPVARYTIEKYLKSLLAIPDEFVSSYNKLAKASVGTNPRTLKRMANILKLLEIIELEETQEITHESRQLMFAALCMQMAFETVYAQLLSDGVKKNLLEVKSEEIPAIFSDALENAQGKKEDLQKQLTRFFKALNEILGERTDGWEQFCDVLKRSGITASGAQQPFIMDAAMIDNTFDPELVGKFVQLSAEISERYKEYFSLLKLSPTVNEDQPNWISIPAIFGWAVDFGCGIEKEGIYFQFYSEDKADVKNCFKQCLKDAGVKFPGEFIQKKGSAKYFMIMDPIPWQVKSSKEDKAASQARFEQARDEVFKWCDAFLPPMQKFYKQKAGVITRISSLVDRIEETFKKSLPEDKGWSYERADFGGALYPEWSSLRIRKDGWSEDYEIQLITDELFANGMNLAISRTENENYEKDKKTEAFFKAWQKAMGEVPDIDEEEGIDRNEEYCAYAVLPEDIANWTEGSLEDNDFAYALDDAQEKAVVSFCEVCAKAVADNEALLDAFAMEKKD